MLSGTKTGLFWRKSCVVAGDGNHPERWGMQSVVGFESVPWKPPCSMCAFWESGCTDPSSSAMSLTAEERQPKVQLLHGPHFEDVLDNGYQEHCVAPYMLPSKHGYGHPIFATVGIKTPVFGFFPILHLHYEKKSVFLFLLKSQNTTGAGGSQRCASLSHPGIDEPWTTQSTRICNVRFWKATICSKVLHLLCAQRCILLFLCLSGTWGKEIVTPSVSLVERISESINRGCPWNKISSSYYFRNKIIGRSLPFYAMPDLNFKMPMTNR